MTPFPISKYTIMITLIKQYELAPCQATLDKIFALISRHNEARHCDLKNLLSGYWRAECIEDFAARLCASPLFDIESMTNFQSRKGILAYLKDPDDIWLEESLVISLAIKYRKTQDVVAEILNAIDCADAIISNLKVNSVICLS